MAVRPEAEEPSPEERYLMIKTLLQLDSLLVGLSVRGRQIFFLSQFDGLTYPQIAAQLNLHVAQGLRMPSLFETNQGVLQNQTGKGLKPERSSNWEIGASKM